MVATVQKPIGLEALVATLLEHGRPSHRADRQAIEAIGSADQALS
jgi:hypothetical protein